MYKIVITTTDDQKTSQSISDYLLENKLSPCVQIINQVESNYIWKGKTNKNDEYLILIKCKNEKLEQISSYIENNHNYETPEIIAVDIDILNNSYKDWFNRNC